MMLLCENIALVYVTYTRMTACSYYYQYLSNIII